MNSILLHRNAWFSDETDTIILPDNWRVQEFGSQQLGELSIAAVIQKIGTPIGTNNLARLAEGRGSAVIIIDDFSRPTPTGDILPSVLKELSKGGIPLSHISIVIATGTHKPPSTEELQFKLGRNIPNEVKVIAHNSKSECIYLGRTTHNTPVFINREVMNNELKISIGSVYPHPAAGFSGGGKILALGTAGEETIRIMHDYRAETSKRSGNIDIIFRKEINEISRKAGLDFSINLLLNQNRGISNIICGEPEIAFQQAVEWAVQNYNITLPSEADIVISDMYPFDSDFQFAFDRGMWPLEKYSQRTVKVVIANSIKGIGGHELFPVANPIRTRLVRRIRNFTLQDITRLPERVSKLLQIILKRKETIFVISSGIKQHELARVMSQAIVFRDFSEFIEYLAVHKPDTMEKIKKVVFVRTAPLMLEG